MAEVQLRLGRVGRSESGPGDSMELRGRGGSQETVPRWGPAPREFFPPGDGSAELPLFANCGWRFSSQFCHRTALSPVSCRVPRLPRIPGVTGVRNPTPRCSSLARVSLRGTFVLLPQRRSAAS